MTDKPKRRTAPEIIATHLCWDMGEVSQGRYQRYTAPSVYVCADDYYCAPTAGQKPPTDVSDNPWELVGTYYDRPVYRALATMVRP